MKLIPACNFCDVQNVQPSTKLSNKTLPDSNLKDNINMGQMTVPPLKAATVLLISVVNQMLQTGSVGAGDVIKQATQRQVSI